MRTRKYIMSIFWTVFIITIFKLNYDTIIFYKKGGGIAVPYIALCLTTSLFTLLFIIIIILNFMINFSRGGYDKSLEKYVDPTINKLDDIINRHNN